MNAITKEPPKVFTPSPELRRQLSAMAALIREIEMHEEPLRDVQQRVERITLPLRAQLKLIQDEALTHYSQEVEAAEMDDVRRTILLDHYLLEIGKARCETKVVRKFALAWWMCRHHKEWVDEVVSFSMEKLRKLLPEAVLDQYCAMTKDVTRRMVKLLPKS